MAEALEEQCGDEPGERLGELAGHWAAAVVSTDTAKAMHYARRAAERALEQLAPDEAVRWYRQALELHEQARGGDRSERCELLIGLGEAQRQIGDPQLSPDPARRGGAGPGAQRYRPALPCGAGEQPRMVQPDRQRWTPSACRRSRPQQRPSRLTTRGGRGYSRCWLSSFIYAGDPARCRALAAKAIEIARAAGNPVALAHTLDNAVYSIWGPDTLQERRRLVDEVIELAPALDDPHLSFLAAERGAWIGAEAGDRTQVESSLAAMRTLAVSVPEPFLASMWLLRESGWALVQGDLQASEQWAIDAYEVGTASGEPDAALLFGAHLFHVRHCQGRSGELVERSCGSSTDMTARRRGGRLRRWP